MTLTPTERTIAAEARFLEEGHRVRLDLTHGYFLVKSDSCERTYEVTMRAHVPAQDIGPERGWLRASCTCPAGRHQTKAAIPCKHAAGVCRRLERHGLATFADGTWRPTADALRLGEWITA